MVVVVISLCCLCFLIKKKKKFFMLDIICSCLFDVRFDKVVEVSGYDIYLLKVWIEFVCMCWINNFLKMIINNKCK